MRALPFAENYADEAHAYHVIEHLYRWEAEDTLREWRRVLKPGGLMVVECPSMDKILRHIFECAQRGEAPSLRMSMWALYGDPSYQDEAMVHRWCYTMAELVGLMEGAGFQGVRLEEPQTHIVARDMRVVGYK